MKKELFKKIFQTFIIPIIISYVVISCILYFIQGSYIYYPPEMDYETCTYFENDEKIIFDGTRMYFNHLSERIVVLYHANAGSACGMAFMTERLRLSNVSYLVMEFTGYGGDGKEPLKKDILRDVANVESFLVEKGFDERIYFGMSLGTGIASYHASISPPDRLLLISPYSSIKDVGAVYFWWLPLNLLLHENYDAVDYLNDYGGELMVVHGSDDTVIPIEFGKRLYDSVPSHDKEFISVDGFGHNDILDDRESFDKMFSRMTE